MSTHLNMSLDDSISKRRTDEPRDRRGGSRGRFKRGGFKTRGDRREDRGGFRKSFRGNGFRRFGRDRFDRFDRDRRDDRERGPRGLRDSKDKFDDDKAPKSSLSQLGIKSRFIRRTRPGAAGGRFGDSRPERIERVERERPISERRRLRVSNLDFNITHKDLMELFAKIGKLTKNKIDYDDLGRSKGTALVEYEKHDFAMEAIREYDGAVLDGKTITVEFDDDAKLAGKKESSLVRKVISKDYNFERGGRRRFGDDRWDNDRGDRRFRGGFKRGGFRSSRYDKFEKRD